MTDEQRFMEKDHERAERFKRERDEARERFAALVAHNAQLIRERRDAWERADRLAEPGSTDTNQRETT